MENPNILLSGNTVYIQISNWDDEDVTPKYVRASIRGVIINLNQMTLEEVLKRSPNAKGCKDLKELIKTYNS